MTNKDKKEQILKLWKERYSAVGIEEKLQGEVTFKEIQHYLKQSEELKEKHKESIRQQRIKDGLVA